MHNIDVGSALQAGLLPSQQARMPELTYAVTQRAESLLGTQLMATWKRIDRLFAGLLVFEWLGGIVWALCRTPRTWDGPVSSIHPHVWQAIILGALITALPVYLALRQPGTTLTRHVVAVSQMLSSALLIHISGGRIETHFHVFGSLAFLAFYRDWRVLITGTVVVAADHVLRNFLAPESVYGILVAGPWRWLEHACWVVFEDIFLIASCRQGVNELKGITKQRALLEQSYASVEETVRERTGQLREAQDELVRVARSAGMAEIATSVLHNVGNVLNSVNISATVVVDKLRQSEVESLVKVGQLISDHKPDLAAYLTADQSGQRIPDFIVDLAQCLRAEQNTMLSELTTLTKGVEHIKQIVTAQQSLAKKSAVITPVEPAKLMEMALTIQCGSLNSAGIEIVRHFEEIPPVLLDQHKIIQILVNLISNAKQATKDGPGGAKQIILETAAIESSQGQRIRFRVSDNGVGIAAQNLDRIFSHGFTTKDEGHGFGLHSSANAAREMNGNLTATSDGTGKGAVFTLEIPLITKQNGELCKT